MERAMKWLKRTIGAVLVSGTPFVLIVNDSEEIRMRWHLENGGFGINSPPQYFDENFCEYKNDFIQIEKLFESTTGSFVGLIGPKGSGKSSTLKFEASKEKYNKRSIICTVDPKNYTSLSEALYDRMYQDIWKLPFFLRQVRLTGGLSKKEIARRVLKSAVAQDGKRVLVFVDINAETETSGSMIDRLAPKPLPVEVANNVSSPRRSFSAESFVREVKYLVQDAELINCMFTSSEGLMFEAEARREYRLALFQSNELSIVMSKSYLKEKFGYDCLDEDVLKKFPRGFHQLQRFGMALDKEDFANRALNAQIEMIRKSIQLFPSRTWFQWLRGVPVKGAPALYREALKHDIGINEIYDIGGMSHKEFIESFVITNIFHPTIPVGKYTLQFDVTRVAVQQVVGGK